MVTLIKNTAEPVVTLHGIGLFASEASEQDVNDAKQCLTLLKGADENLSAGDVLASMGEGRGEIMLRSLVECGALSLRRSRYDAALSELRVCDFAHTDLDVTSDRFRLVRPFPVSGGISQNRSCIVYDVSRSNLLCAGIFESGEHCYRKVEGIQECESAGYMDVEQNKDKVLTAIVSSIIAGKEHEDMTLIDSDELKRVASALPQGEFLRAENAQLGFCWHSNPTFVLLEKDNMLTREQFIADLKESSCCLFDDDDNTDDIVGAAQDPQYPDVTYEDLKSAMFNALYDKSLAAAMQMHVKYARQGKPFNVALISRELYEDLKAIRRADPSMPALARVTVVAHTCPLKVIDNADDSVTVLLNTELPVARAALTERLKVRTGTLLANISVYEGKNHRVLIADMSDGSELKSVLSGLKEKQRKVVAEVLRSKGIEGLL